MLTRVATICIAITTSLGTIATLSVILRFYCRLKVQKIALGADDWCILVSLILSIGTAILTSSIAALTGVGDPSSTPAYDQVVFALKAGYIFELLQIMCMGLIKISVLLFYKKLFVFQIFQIIANVLIGLIICFDFSIIVAVFLSKGLPISKLWDPTAPFEIKTFDLLQALCAGNAALDILTLMLPISVVRNLHVRTSKKLHLFVIFTLGFSCIAASITRLYYATQLHTIEGNFSAAFVRDVLWALVEPPIFILAACLLTLGPMLRGKYGPVHIYRVLSKKLGIHTEHNLATYGPGTPMNNLYTPAKRSTESTSTVRLPLNEIR